MMGDRERVKGAKKARMENGDRKKKKKKTFWLPRDKSGTLQSAATRQWPDVA
jgi:hypothetical protein